MMHLLPEVIFRKEALLGWMVIVLLCTVSAETNGASRGNMKVFNYSDDTASFERVRVRSSDFVQQMAVVRLLNRLLSPAHAAMFSVHVNRAMYDQNGRDAFNITSNGSHVEVAGSSGVSAAWAVLHYLKQVCHLQVSWDYDQLHFPQHIPRANITVRANDRFRYYGNVCTGSYSSVWWTWHRWERHLDWLALNGYNLVLMFVGQEAVWRRVWLEFGITDSEMRAYFTGAPFLAWNRMGNIKQWAGPLSDTWLRRQLRLAVRIVARMRELGITPVLPSFSGHVPDAIARLYPGAQLSRFGSWNHFNTTYSSTLFLNPTDPLFSTITARFIAESTRVFNGTDHVYACDLYNEMTPSGGNVTNLAQTARATLDSMTSVDRKALWLLQGWMFIDKFWKPNRVKHFLTAIPKGRLLILDLYADVLPLYRRLQLFYGHAFIWCMLHNFGGKSGLQGTVAAVIKGPIEAREVAGGRMVGTGLTMEGIFQNYVMYDLMSEMGWRQLSPDINQWSRDYVVRRYSNNVVNNSNGVLQQAWTYLMRSVYNRSTIDVAVLRSSGMAGLREYISHIHTVLDRRPSLSPHSTVGFNVKHLLAAWDLLIQSCSLLVNTSVNRSDEINNIYSTYYKIDGANLSHGVARDTNLAHDVARDTNLTHDVACVTNLAHVVAHDTNLAHGVVRDTNLAHDVTAVARDTNLVHGVARDTNLAHDVTDVTREVMAQLLGEIHERMIKSFRQRRLPHLRRYTRLIDGLLVDLDQLLGSDQLFLLGSWIRDAKHSASSHQERVQFEWAWRNQLTLWGPEANIVDYAGKQWAGLIADYYRPRWLLFSRYLEKCLTHHRRYNQSEVNELYFQLVELPFTTSQKVYPHTSKGNSLVLAMRIYQRYRRMFRH